MLEFLHQSVTKVAKDRPDAIAFRCGKESISYSDLDKRSNQLANRLLEDGAKKGDRVGVFMPRGVQSCIAIYGVFKAGCVFVALDPNLTSGSLARLIQNCQISQLLTHAKQARSVLPLLNGHSNGRSSLKGIIGLPPHEDFAQSPVKLSPWENLEAYSPVQPEVELSSSDPAYIMYSSGSTGSPKGITHSHSSGMSYCRLSIQTYGVNEDDVIANHSPINFDMSTFGYFTSCVAGF